MLLVLSTLPPWFKHVSRRCCCGGGYTVPFVRKYKFTCLNHEWLHWEENSASRSFVVLVSLPSTLCNHSAFFSVGLVALLICQWSETRAQAVAHFSRRGQASPRCHSISLQRSAFLVKLTNARRESKIWETIRQESALHLNYLSVITEIYWTNCFEFHIIH